MPNRSKAIFLDVDGTLNTPENPAAWCALGNPLALDLDKVDRVRRIQEATGAIVVLCSMWRLPGASAGYAKTILCLEARGWPNARAVFSPECTPLIGDGDRRGEEIASYAADHPEITRFVVLDDDMNMKPVLDHWIPINYRTGIREEQVAIAIEKLGT